MMNNYNKNIDINNCILFFCNTLCFPCELLEKELKEIKYPIIKINIEDNLEVAKQYDVTSIPSLLFIKNNKTIYTMTGVRKTKDINKVLIHFDMI